MVKKKKNTGKQRKQNTNIQNLKESRLGGQTALAGYSYQFLYSCYLILSETHKNTVYHLEGIEDIDCIKSIDQSEQEDNNFVTHIQLKYSTRKQDASFLKKILKNFLEVYLIDSKRKFKLVYDFEVSNGNFSKLINDKLDTKSTKYWQEKIIEIKQENPSWNWSDFNFGDFICELSFENVKKDFLAAEIEKLLISNFKIATDNISLYANGIKILCLQKMEIGGSIKKEDITRKLSSIQEDIEKGANNPAINWIKRIEFNSNCNKNTDLSYYEGKKPTSTDIANKLPVKRFLLEK